MGDFVVHHEGNQIEILDPRQIFFDDPTAVFSHEVVQKRLVGISVFFRPVKPQDQGVLMSGRESGRVRVIATRRRYGTHIEGGGIPVETKLAIATNCYNNYYSNTKLTLVVELRSLSM